MLLELKDSALAEDYDSIFSENSCLSFVSSPDSNFIGRSELLFSYDSEGFNHSMLISSILSGLSCSTYS